MMPKVSPTGHETTQPAPNGQKRPSAPEVPQALLDRRGGRPAPTPESWPLPQELTTAIPPVDDLGQAISLSGGCPRFVFGDGGERRMTRHLWSAILAEGLDEETRRDVEASRIAPPSLAGPLPPRAGLRLMRSGVFYALAVDGGDREVRWLAGTLFRGGHVDRLLTEDTIVPGGARDMILSCFACEGHRPSTGDRQLSAVAHIIAPPTLRQLARQGDQFAFWERVARLCHRFAPTTRSLAQVLSSSAVDSVIREEMPALLGRLDEGETPGVVLLWQGVPIAADLFQSEADFAESRDALLRGYVVEAMVQADCHCPTGMEVLSARSSEGKRALAKLLAAQEQGAHLESWHTFLCA